MCKQKFEVTEFEFPSLQLLLLPKHYVPPIHYLFTFTKNYFPPFNCLFTLPKHYLPPFHCMFTLPKLVSLLSTVCLHSIKIYFPCYCFNPPASEASEQSKLA